MPDRLTTNEKFAILQAITTDPTMTTDPVKRKILYMMMENGGINPNDILDVSKKDMAQIVDQQKNNPMKMGGGGVSAPSMNNKVPGISGQTM